MEKPAFLEPVEIDALTKLDSEDFLGFDRTSMASLIQGLEKDLIDEDEENNSIAGEVGVPVLPIKKVLIIGQFEHSLSLRKEFYDLQRHTNNLEILDAGNIPDIPEDEQLEELGLWILSKLKEDYFVVLLGGDSDTVNMLGHATAQFIQEPANFCLITDAPFRTTNTDTPWVEPDEEWTRWMGRLSILGYQTYLTRPESVQWLDANWNAHLRLGHLREHFEEAEPLIRDAHFTALTSTALKVNTVSAEYKNPFGITSEEACRLAWYCGLNPQLSSFWLGLPDDDTESMGFAVILWYLLHGLAGRMEPPNFNGTRLDRYHVMIEGGGEIVFYREATTDMWWMQIPIGNTLQTDQTLKVPCSQTDYTRAVEGYLPDMWMRLTARYSGLAR